MLPNISEADTDFQGLSTLPTTRLRLRSMESKILRDLDLASRKKDTPPVSPVDFRLCRNLLEEARQMARAWFNAETRSEGGLEATV